MAGSRRDMEGGPPVPPRDRGRPRQGPVLHRPISQAPQPHPPARVFRAEARGLLERELAALSLRPLDASLPLPCRWIAGRPPLLPAPWITGLRLPGRRICGPAPPCEWNPGYLPPLRGPRNAGLPLLRARGNVARAGRRRQAAGPEWAAPHTEDRVPYTSLMAALSTATPAVLAETVKPAPQERARPARKRKRLPWRSAVTILALAATAALPVYTLWNGGRGPAQARLAIPNLWLLPRAFCRTFPLPSRRPAALGGQHSPGRNAPASSAEK